MKRQAVRADDWVAITPNDTQPIPNGVPSALWVTVAGNIAMQSVNGNSITVTVPVGQLPLCPEKVLSTGTTATVYALY